MWVGIQTDFTEQYIKNLNRLRFCKWHKIFCSLHYHLVDFFIINEEKLWNGVIWFWLFYPSLNLFEIFKRRIWIKFNKCMIDTKKYGYYIYKERVVQCVSWDVNRQVIIIEPTYYMKYMENINV